MFSDIPSLTEAHVNGITLELNNQVISGGLMSMVMSQIFVSFVPKEFLLVFSIIVPKMDGGFGFGECYHFFFARL